MKQPSTFPCCKDCGHILKAPYTYRRGIGYLHYHCTKADTQR